MNTIDDLLKVINRDVGFLAPFVVEKSRKAIRRCWDKYLRVEIFEGWRSAVRQDVLFSQGRDAAGHVTGKPVTNSKGWQSFHQFGLAFDLAFINGTQWSWTGDWDEVIQIFQEEGFESLRPYEQAHMQITAGIKISDAMKTAQTYGVQALWLQVQHSVAAKSG